MAGRPAESEGHWSNAEFPALTALAVWALAANGSTEQAAIDKGVQYILGCARDDGSIFKEPSEERKGGGLANYNTAICMVALHAVGNPSSRLSSKARKFIAGPQHLGGDHYEAAWATTRTRAGPTPICPTPTSPTRRCA